MDKPDRRAVVYVCPYEGVSIRTQMMRVMAWLMSRRIQPAEIYQDDAPVPGQALRPGLVSALQAVYHDPELVVVVAAYGVIGEGMPAQEAFRAEVRRSGADLYVMTDDGTGDDPYRKFLDEYEPLRQEWFYCGKSIKMHKVIKRRVKEENGFAGGRAPIGYRHERGHLVADARGQALVLKILELRRGGDGLRVIAGILRSDGHKTPNGLPPERWHPEMVRRVLDYYGDPHTGTPGKYDTDAECVADV